MREVLLILAITFAAGTAYVQTDGGGGPSSGVRAMFEPANM